MILFHKLFDLGSSKIVIFSTFFKIVVIKYIINFLKILVEKREKVRGVMFFIYFIEIEDHCML